jgi:arginyl-tRNA synthetase
VVVALFNFPKVVHDAAAGYDPSLLANHLYQLAKAYNHFYQEHAVLRAEGEQRAFRITLSRFTAFVLKRGMRMLGIEVPERM